MRDASPNPYESPQVAACEQVADSQQGYWGWRLIPAAVFAALGCLSCVGGLLLALTALTIWLDSTEFTLADWWAVKLSGGMLFVGVAWIVAGFAFEHRKYGTALVTTFAGFVPPAIWFLTVRW